MGFRILGFLLLLLSCTAESSFLRRSLESSKTLDVLVSFKDCKVSDILNEFTAKSSDPNHPIQGRSLPHPNSLPDVLKNHASESQEKVLDFLQAELMAKSSVNTAFDFQSLWLTNKVLIRNASADLVSRLVKFPQVAEVVEDKLYHLGSSFSKPERPSSTAALVELNLTSSEKDFKLPYWWPDLPDIAVPDLPNIQLNILSMGAVDVWKAGYTGRGQVIGVIDSGVNSNHLLLVRNFRGNYGWYDPINGRSTPYDDHGHGTHSVGVAAGRAGIGVAPDAEFMACKAVNRDGYYRESWLSYCASYMICPWDSSGDVDCTKRPRVVMIPWTLPKGMRQLDMIVEAFDAAGILTVVSAGNYGQSGCKTIMPPADIPSVFAVGALNQHTRQVMDTTGAGPGLRHSIKPDVTAPGLNVRSASYRRSSGLLYMSGSDPAAAHVAGIIALALQKNPNFTMDDLRASILFGTADVDQTNRTCAGVGTEPTPNYSTGFGFMDARLSVNMIPKF